jgi:hypothetical protein
MIVCEHTVESLFSFPASRYQKFLEQMPETETFHPDSEEKLPCQQDGLPSSLKGQDFRTKPFKTSPE